MRTASRHMPKYKRRKLNGVGLLILVSFMISTVICAGTLIFHYPEASFVALGVTAVLFIFCVEQNPKILALQALAEIRSGQSIGTFAQEFNLRKIDPWVVRAVYEQLQELLVNIHPQFPVRAEDRLDDLLLDPDDLEMRLAFEIAVRTLRCLEGLQPNPDRNNVITVRDLVSFMNAQPKAP